MTDQQRRTLRQMAARGGACLASDLSCASSLRGLVRLGLVEQRGERVTMTDEAWVAALTIAQRDALRYAVERGRGRVTVGWAGSALCLGMVSPPAAKALCKMGLTETVGRGARTKLELTCRGDRVARAVVGEVAA